MILAWGAKVNESFRNSVIGMTRRLRIADPNWLMACMAFETGETFSPSIVNSAGSGAVGLIQFMPGTAAAMGTSTEALGHMTAENQLVWVERYFRPWNGRLHNLGDVYGAILWPGMIGKSDRAIIFEKDSPIHPKYYLQNRGLDADRDGFITKGEIVAHVERALSEGLKIGNIFNDEGIS